MPSDPATRDDRCDEIFHTQVAGLAKRLEHIGNPPVSIGVSGGLDSTLALLVACKTFDDLGVPRDRVQALTMPGFGTTSRTQGQRPRPDAAARRLGPRDATSASCAWTRCRRLGHRPFGIAARGRDGRGADREAAAPAAGEPRTTWSSRTCRPACGPSLLMNTGFVIGTGDLSELALGWCTYNADHMSMYNPNVSIPKTLVKFLVQWAAEQRVRRRRPARRCSTSSTPQISPELLPTDASGKIVQSTEAAIGPYELHDFFLYHFLRFGAAPEKILFLAEHADVREAVPARRAAAVAARVPAALLRQPVQAQLPAGRPEGRLGQPVAARRLAHALRRRRPRLAR